MSIGESTWQGYMGAMNKESSMKLLDAYYDAGGNFIDTANLYQDGTSEEIIGEWAEKRGIRDRLFIATKYAHNFHLMKREEPHRILFAGGNAKSLHTSIKGSLERLRTDYIDLLYVHWWDYDTSVEEVMQSLHTLILQRKVLYLGISDAPAWVVSMANQYAKDHALTPFSVYQGAWNVLDRSFEREIIPMARAQGMALAPWNVLCGGRIRSDAEEERRAATNENGRGGAAWRRTEKETLMSQVLEKVAAEVGAKHITSVAIAYVMQKTTHVFPIIGGRKVEHLLQNIEALDISLSDEHISWIENVVQFDPGFPTNLIGNGVTYNGLWLSSGKLDKIRIEPIRPKPRSTGNEKV
ncbi:Aryl-alcohol dehydrogenase [NADP(+)] [Psilocybe cubensis]|uniref:NADP-dependent oxidoreductase domain-containing protein n=2 Tax=Psilocybe cubensis TaxID=181762 RepID=A0A8H7XQH1_PSICU|nr:Aryl-alcohol dehydrogenase [NADP(+)] [Psilocybe cubensis]KAH9475019.1 Aryl-alcohol dehydrogenase [NADP(+)] [Psilocybe cubensis]